MPRKSVLSALAIFLYRINRERVRSYIRRFIHKREGGDFFSVTLREIYQRFHQVKIGMYTQGAFSKPGQIDRFTDIGRYCSLASNVRIMNRNHPLEFKSTHAFFFNPRLGYCREDNVKYIPLHVGNDVWIGHNAIIHPHVRSIGDGAVVGAGAVVNKDVPPYTVVVGNPARVVRYRFSKEVIQELLESKWWEKSIEELKPHIQEFQQFIGNPTLIKQAVEE